MKNAEFEKHLRYRTPLGRAYQGDALQLLATLEDESVQAVITSPPFALKRKKEYGNPPEHEYCEWFADFAREFHRVLRPDGSLVIEIGGAWMPKSPTRSIYQFELLISLVRDLDFKLAEEFYWFNRAKLPGPAQWVNIERIRVKDAVSPIWWLSKTDRPKADNRRVLKPYSPSQLDLFRRGYNRGPRPSGHVIGDKFSSDNGGAIPPNLIEVANTRSVDPYQAYCRDKGLDQHPARFPRELPEFFVKFLTEPGDLVLDPFGGSNMTGAVAESLGRRWITFELFDEYLEGSIGRFDTVEVVNPFQPGALRKTS
ncbi:MAG: site-specific DNA-methyltransferase [Acidimicrobiales bacterium]|nr:site-specific DNA-methyltransferase [Acidimicrobiales bacterium]